MNKEILNLVLDNLLNLGFAIILFMFSYLSNILLGVYQNVKQFKQEFDKNKILDSCLKFLFISLSLILITVTVTCLPIFANSVGWTIPDDYIDVFSNLTIIGSCLYVSCRYLFEAVKKFMEILNK